MVTGKKLSRKELAFWQRAFLAAQITGALKGNGRKRSPEYLAHLASDYASAAVEELRRVDGLR